MNKTLHVTQVVANAAVMCALLAAGNANAAGDPQSADDSVFASIGIGGLNLGYGKRFNNQWGGRVMLNSGIKSDNKNETIHGNRYEFDYKSSAGLSVLGDFYPINDSGFRVSGGLQFARHKLELEGKASSYTLNGNSYSAADVGKLSGEAKFWSVAPYLGVGWESKPSAGGWRFVSDLGVRYLGKASSKLDASNANTNAALRRDLAAERQHLEKRAAELVASVGVSYSF